jgi:hypothetical protein
MKHVFRLGFVVIPFLFFVSTTAYPAGAPHHHNKKKTGRAPAAVVEQKLELSKLTALDGITMQAQASHKRSIVDTMSAVTPPFGRGVGVATSIFRF